VITVDERTKVEVEAREGEEYMIEIRIAGDEQQKLNLSAHILAFLKFDLDQLAKYGLRTKVKSTKKIIDATEEAFSKVTAPTPEMLAKLLSEQK